MGRLPGSRKPYYEGGSAKAWRYIWGFITLLFVLVVAFLWAVDQMTPPTP